MSLPSFSPTGQVLATTSNPAPAYYAGALKYNAAGELYMSSAAPAGQVYAQGFRFAADGALYVSESPPQAYNHGLGFRLDGALSVSSSPPSGYSNGLPISAGGGVSVSGLVPPGPVPIFFAPLLSTLVPTTAGNPTSSFTRATIAYVPAVGPAGNAVNGEMLVQCQTNEARFVGARRIAGNNWSPTYADGSPIPTASLRGYLAEPSRSNICLQSQTFGSATWNVKTNATITDNNQIAPDGALTAATFVASAAAAQLGQLITIGAAGNHILSIYMKRLTGVGAINITPDNSTVAPTNVAGLINSATWTRVLAVASFAGGNVTPSILVPTAGDSIAIWAAQFEFGVNARVTSYIPTTTAIASRAIDVLSYSAAGNLVAALGSATAEASGVPAPDGNSKGVLSLEPAACYPMVIGGGNSLVSYDGTGAINTANVITNDVPFKCGTRWGVSGQRGIVLNGGAIVNGAFDGLMNGTTMQIGNWATSANGSIGGAIKNMKVYDIALTDLELIAATT